MDVADIRKLEDGDLRKELDGKKRGLMDLRFRKTSGQLSNTSQLRKNQRDVARILTVINERKILAELNIKEDRK